MTRLWLALLALMSLSMCLVACERCSHAPLARLESKSGTVDRDLSRSVGQWSTSSPGDSFDDGDGVRTASKAQAFFALEGGSRLRVDESSIVRFLTRKPGAKGQGMNVEMGAASLEVGAAELELETSMGIARLEPFSKVRLARSADSLRYEVLVGAASFEDGQGNETKLAAGQGILVGVGAAILERYEVTDEPSAKAPKAAVSASAAEAAPAPADVGQVQAEVTGPGVQVQDGAGGKLEKLPPGSHALSSGSTLKVPKGSHVDLSRGNDRATVRGAGTYVVGGDELVKLESGSMTVSSDDTVRVVVPGGVIVAKAGGSAEIDSSKGDTTVRVVRAQVAVESANAKESLAAGEVATLSAEGEIAVQGRGLSYADVETAVGASVVIHDPNPPTAVRFSFGDKCKEGVIRFEGRQANFARGSGSVAVALKPGSAPYALYCVTDAGIADKPAAEGRVTIMHDAGLRPVPKEAPATSVELDGRNYTVLYQNQMPRVMLRWSKAPSESGPFVVHVSGPNGGRTYSAKTSSFTLPAGALGDGTHVVHMDGGGRVSRQSSVTIRFDNAAPTATLETPVATQAKAGQPLSVAGTVLPGWSVSVNGTPVALDGSRFVAQANMPTGERALAIVLTHPQRGTHIYLRRAAGAP